jgi:hypothetical protein
MNTEELRAVDMDEFAGKDITWINDSQSQKAKVMYDYDIGLSLVDVNDSSDCLVNYQGPYAKDTNRFTSIADYEVKLKPGEKMNLLLKALDELYKSKYITKVTQFDISYVPMEEGKENEIDEISIKIRLYFE